ncbi:hypothetical protein EVAR_65796_1 [Eumeta japonica]|uniref:Uncharacterized protein n=1 Tax=Eumeta variegata TaxID=151549 RepID=A0A4C1ZRH5_EUMVA|nr:hypothetical protein EVAR_65796_1 [Eumeta japonica]
MLTASELTVYLSACSRLEVCRCWIFWLHNDVERHMRHTQIGLAGRLGMNIRQHAPSAFNSGPPRADDDDGAVPDAALGLWPSHAYVRSSVPLI